MFQYKKTVPGDPTILPGMHTILADRGQSYQVNYIKDVEYVQRMESPCIYSCCFPAGCCRGWSPPCGIPWWCMCRAPPGESSMCMAACPSWFLWPGRGLWWPASSTGPPLRRGFPRLFAGREVGDPVPAGQRGEVFHRSQPGGDLGGFLRRPRRPDGGRHRGHGGI